MDQQDSNELDRSLRDLTNALYEIQEIYDDSQKVNYTVDNQAYKEPQKDAQQAIVDLMQFADEVADRTDEFTTQDGTTIQLPRQGLSRDIDNMPVMPK